MVFYYSFLNVLCFIDCVQAYSASLLCLPLNIFDDVSSRSSWFGLDLFMLFVYLFQEV